MKEATLDHLMQTLGWTLIHSLWQTFLVALCLYVLLAFSYKLSPSIKYMMGVVALLFTGFLATTTYLDLYFHHQPALEELQKDMYTRGISDQSMEFSHIQPAQISEQTISFQLNQVIHEIKAYVNLHLHWVVALWMTGVLLLSLRFTGSLFYIHRLKKRLVNPLAEKWQNKMRKMAALLQLQPSVKLLSSEIAKVPMMIGHLKPVILIPASMMSGLPEDQLEAIIAHEIAHIHRKDYWINILQSLFEIIFFFHPAIWWISSVIRDEREKCCDDLAVKLCGDSMTYAKALASIEEVKLQHSQVALAINGGKRSLFQRVERILQPGKSAGNQRARFVSASLALITLILLGSASDSIAFRYGEKKANEAIQWMATIYLEDEEAKIKPLVFDFDRTQYTKKGPFQKLKQLDTIPQPIISPVSPVNPVSSSVQQARVATAISNQIHAFPNINPLFMNLDVPDSIPDLDVDISTLLDSLSDLDFSFEMDSGFAFSFKDGNTHQLHFDAPDIDVSTFMLDLDSAMNFRIPNDSLPLAIAQLDSSLWRLHTYTNAYQFHVQDTSIEKRLRELEASMRKKDQELKKLIQEKEQVIQGLLHEKELEIIEEQMLQQEEQMRIQEEMMDQQMEDLEKQLEKMEEQEEMIRQQESRFHEANKVLEEKLLKDGLIQKGEKYSFKISSKGLFINDEKQSDQYYNKYLKWMRENEVFHFEEGSTLSITRIAH